MDIKDIALKVGLQAFEEHPYDKGHVVSPSGYTWIDDKLIDFAEALIAEIAKQNKPAAFTNGSQLGYVTSGQHPDIPLAMWSRNTSYSGADIPLYTSPPTAEQIANETAWQPIETAPKDETFLAVLACGEHQQICTMRWPVAEAKNSRIDNGEFILERVTHWMPLPKAPNGASL